MRLTFLLPILLATAPLTAQAACTSSGFTVTHFASVPHPNTRRISLSGDLVNQCSVPAGAQVRIIAKDAQGNVIESEQAWPAGSSNVQPGKAKQFNFGPLFEFSPNMSSFEVEIVKVREW